jgi:SAM-dependent methyltransferase
MYDRRLVAAFYDEHGADEPMDLPSRIVSDRIHSAVLREHVAPHARVLEVGAGVGTFTLALINLGARVVATDISSRQLVLNRARIRKAGLAADYCVADLTDLSMFHDGQFDAVVSFRGPLSLALDKAEAGLQGMLRVTRPGGVVLFSAFSYFGWLRSNLTNLLRARRGSYSLAGRLLRTRMVPPLGGPPVRLFSLHELQQMVDLGGGTFVTASADSFLTSQMSLIPGTARGQALVRDLMAVEEEACNEGGLIEAGSRIVVVARRLTTRMEREEHS